MGDGDLDDDDGYEAAAAAATTASSSSFRVLYVDHAGHPSPLSECYHATASRRLASSCGGAAARFPASAAEEVDSAYCPHCLSSHDPHSGARLRFCPKPTCRRCPVCQSVAVISTGTATTAPSTATTTTTDDDDANLKKSDDVRCYYRCGTCTWNSFECDLYSKIMATEEGGDDNDDERRQQQQGPVVDRLQLARAAEDLLQELNRRKSEPSLAIERHLKGVTEEWKKKNRRQHRSGTTSGVVGGGGRRGSRDIAASGAVATAAVDDPLRGWSVEALESSLREKKKEFSKVGTTTDDAQLPDGVEIRRPSLDVGDDVGDGTTPPPLDESLYGIPKYSFRLQGLNTPALPAKRSDLLPLPVPLQVRTSRRCRAELAEGRPGILLKPKMNPLEGDSSQRKGHGQWWKKVSTDYI